MNRHANLLLFLFGVLLATFSLSCTKTSDDDTKPAADLKGTYTGSATNKVNSTDKKALSITITNSDPPLAGTYTFNGVAGKITGSVLGLIINMTLKPDASGTTYSFAAAADDNDTSLSGTMTGVESMTSVTYTVLVKK